MRTTRTEMISSLCDFGFSSGSIFPSKCLHVFQQVPFLVRTKIRSPEMTFVAVPLLRRVIEGAGLLCFRSLCDEAHVLLIKNVIAAIEADRTVFFRHQQVPHGGNR